MSEVAMTGSKKGLLIVYTGAGKGKTTAALGAALRAVGRGRRVCLVQFIKSRPSGEMEAARRLDPELEIAQCGIGFVGMGGDKHSVDEHRAAARQALDLARDKVASGSHFLAILDEVNLAMSLELVEPQEVLELWETAPPGLHMILTGRGAPDEVIERADLVTEMLEVKHPYQSGRPAVAGLDF